MDLPQRSFLSQKIWMNLKIVLVYSVIIFKGCSGYTFPPGEGFLESCDFEANVGSGSRTCYWYQSNAGVADWILTNQPIVPEANAGLTTDHSPTGNGYFWVARRTGSNFPGNRAFIEKRVRGGESKIMNIWVHMSGDVGSLTVELCPITGCGLNHTAVYSIQGNQAQFWQKTADIPIADCDDFIIRIEAQLKGIDTSIAIDDIEFRPDGRMQMEPSPTVPRDEVCWNDGDFILSIVQHHHHHCCCAPGFTGVYCQTNIDECVTQNGNSLCSAGSTCLDLVDGFSCRCRPGFSGTFCDVNDNECEGVVCERGGVCEDLENDYRCRCPGGYEGKRCEREVDDCIGVECQNGGTCVDLFNSYICDCLPGFEGRHCDLNIDECLSSPCGYYATCVDTEGSYWCHCPAGLKSVDGTSCLDTVNSCISTPCQYGAECVDKPLGFDCRCRDGTAGDFCEINVNECENVVCQNNGVCVDGLNSYACNCKYGFTGQHCEVNLRNNFCIAACDRFDSCRYDNNQTECVCPAGYTGSRCSFEINECSPSPCVQGTCTDMLADYHCTCERGWSGEDCDQPFDFCAADSVCSKYSQCVNTPHGAVCVCYPGYTGYSCMTSINICDRVHCMNGGECMVTADSSRPWYCNCDDSHVGKYCEVEVVETTDGVVLAQAQEAVCMHFWSLPSKLKGSVLSVCIVTIVAVILIGALVIECTARNIKRQKTAKSTQPHYPYKFYQ